MERKLKIHTTGVTDLTGGVPTNGPVLTTHSQVSSFPTFILFTDPPPSFFSISTISIFLADPPPSLLFISTTSIFPKEPPPPWLFHSSLPTKLHIHKAFYFHRLQTTCNKYSDFTKDPKFRFQISTTPKLFVELDRHNTRNPGCTRTLDLTIKLHDAEYSSNASGTLSSCRLSGLAPNSELTENGRASGNTIFSGLTEKYRASKKSPENLHDPAGARISDLTGKHRHSGGGGCSCSSGTMPKSCKSGPLPASKLAVPHKLEEAEENDKLFIGQILNP